MLPCITTLKSTCTMLRKNTWIIYLAWHYLIIIISATPTPSPATPWPASTRTITSRGGAARRSRIALRWNNCRTVAVCRILFCSWCCGEHRSCVVGCGCCCSSSLLAGLCCGYRGWSRGRQKLLVSHTDLLNGPRNCFNTFSSRKKRICALI